MFFELNLIQSYKFQDIDAERFLDQRELSDYQDEMAKVLNNNSDLAQNDLRIVQKFNKSRHEYFIHLTEITKIKISNFLLRMAIKYRYEEKMPRTEGGPGRTPGKWWGHILNELDECPEILKLSPNQASWLIEVWNHDTVQNSWEPSLQSWVNIFSDEIDRLDKVYNGKEEIIEIEKN